MKAKYIFYLLVADVLFFFMCLVFSGCEEVPVVIPDFVPPSSDKVILMEEFTGADCGPCPAGAAEIQDLLATFSENLIAIGVHAGALAKPLPESKHDFKIEEGQAIYESTGAIGTPMAAISRIQFEGIPRVAVFNPWRQYISQALEQTPFAQTKLEIVNTFNSSDRSLDINITILPQVDLSGDIRLSVMLVQDEIIDAQNVNGETQVDYKHKHVLLDMLTAFDGDNISNSLSSTDLLEQNFSFTVPVEFEGMWNVGGLSVVAFVSIHSENTKEVLQAAQEYISG